MDDTSNKILDNLSKFEGGGLGVAFFSFVTPEVVELSTQAIQTADSLEMLGIGAAATAAYSGRLSKKVPDARQEFSAKAAGYGALAATTVIAATHYIPQML